MQKYKIVASKSQKKYTLIISAESESDARDRIHKEGYSILWSSLAQETDIQGQKFIFQIEVDGKIKNGVIVGKDIFKVYIKLVDELGYNIICLYPEWDDAHNDAEKKQKIMEQLQKWYQLQKESSWKKKNKKLKKEDSFYLKKELDEVSVLIESVIWKLDKLLSESQKYNIEQKKLWKLQQLYNKLIHIKGSTNLSKLREIGELALLKIGEIELSSIENDKNKESWILLDETNKLLKQIWSDQHFIQRDKDIKYIIWSFFSDLKKSFSLSELRNTYFVKKEKQLIDTQSYSFLKTVLLLEKYKERLKQNTQDIRKNLKLFINPFRHGATKDKIQLTRRVIKQNISILKAKKTGSLSSYTSIKKWYHQITNNLFVNIKYFKTVILAGISFFCFCFFLSNTLWYVDISFMVFNPQALSLLLLVFFLFFILCLSKNIFSGFVGIVFFLFIFIFFKINF